MLHVLVEYMLDWLAGLLTSHPNTCTACCYPSVSHVAHSIRALLRVFVHVSVWIRIRLNIVWYCVCIINKYKKPALACFNLISVVESSRNCARSIPISNGKHLMLIARVLWLSNWVKLCLSLTFQKIFHFQLVPTQRTMPFSFRQIQTDYAYTRLSVDFVSIWFSSLDSIHKYVSW